MRRLPISLAAPVRATAPLWTLLGAASALYDKFLLARIAPPPTVQLHFSAGLVLLYGAAWLARRALWPRAERTPFAWRWTITLTGALLVLSDAFYFHAVAQPGAAISLVSVFRRASAVVAFLAGGLLFRDLHLRRKGLALILVLAGAALAALG